MLDPVVQAAFVVIVTWLLKLLAQWLNIPIDEKVLNTLATAIVAFILSQLFPPVVRGVLASFR